LPVGGGMLAVAGYARWRCGAWQNGHHPPRWLTSSATLLLLGWLAASVSLAPARNNSYFRREASAATMATLGQGGETFAWVARHSFVGWLVLQIVCTVVTFLLWRRHTQVNSRPRPPSLDPAHLLFGVLAPAPILLLILAAIVSP
ncbi:MAG: hypothetical protein ACRCYU_15590, partial [Nocardioides sp.]